MMKTVEERLDTFLDKPAAWAGWLGALLLLLPHSKYLTCPGAYVAGPLTVGLHLMGWAALLATAWALYHNALQWRARIAGALSMSVAALLLVMLVGVPVRAAVWTDPAYMMLLAAGFSAAGVGLWRAQWWSRWLAMGLAMAGLVAFVLNGMAVPFLHTWMGWLCVALAAGSALVLVNVSGSAMAEQFELGSSAPTMWQRSEQAVAWLRRAMVLNTMALPMLFVFAWEQPAIQALPWVQALAALFGVALGAGLFLAGRGAIVGLGLMVASGAAAMGLLGVLSVVTGGSGAVVASVPAGVLFYYGVFWLPATISAVVALGQLLPDLVERVAPSNTSPFDR